MTTSPLVVRSLRRSNLGWFLQTRWSVGEAAGRERAININRDVMTLWFGNVDRNITEIGIRTKYLSGFGVATHRPREVVSDLRTLRLQGGGKNWRLAGDAVRGPYYDVREDDLMLMDFDAAESTLNWAVVRRGTSGPTIPGEDSLHESIIEILGPTSDSMWIVTDESADEIRGSVTEFLPAAAELFEDSSVSTEMSDLVSEGSQPTSRQNSYSDLLLSIGDPIPVSRLTGTSTTSFRRSSLTRRAVLLRSGGRCENPDCSGMPNDVSRSGTPILDVDHVVDLGLGGPDHPSNMIALCPNCHAMKTRGKKSEVWRSLFLRIAIERHASSSSPARPSSPPHN